MPFSLEIQSNSKQHKFLKFFQKQKLVHLGILNAECKEIYFKIFGVEKPPQIQFSNSTLQKKSNKNKSQPWGGRLEAHLRPTARPSPPRPFPFPSVVLRNVTAAAPKAAEERASSTTSTRGPQGGFPLLKNPAPRPRPNPRSKPLPSASISLFLL